MEPILLLKTNSCVRMSHQQRRRTKVDTHSGDFPRRKTSGPAHLSRLSQAKIQCATNDQRGNNHTGRRRGRGRERSQPSPRGAPSVSNEANSRTFGPTAGSDLQHPSRTSMPLLRWSCPRFLQSISFLRDECKPSIGEVGFDTYAGSLNIRQRQMHRGLLRYGARCKEARRNRPRTRFDPKMTICEFSVFQHHRRLALSSRRTA